MPPQTQPKKDIYSIVNELSMSLSNLDTKIRINEQNIFNEMKRVQLTNKNILDFKKEVRDQLDVLTNDNEKIKETLKNLEGLIERLKKEPVKEKVTLKKPTKELTSEDADKILEDVLKSLST